MAKRLWDVERGTGFGWDNEFEAQLFDVPQFSIIKHKVTNGEYLDYVEQSEGVPHYWINDASGWSLRTIVELIPLPLDWPVYVTHKQVTQYALYMGALLPNEAQWDFV